MPPKLPEHDVVLLGIGHTNAHVLRMWRMEPIRATLLTCVSNFPSATYSGMLPGVLAGQYQPEMMEIDLVRLCAAAGARLILGNVVGLNRERRELLFDDRPPLPFDVLSIGVGSVPSRDGLEAADDTLLPIKPMQTFLPRLEERLKSIPAAPSSRDAGMRIVIVGGGVGGVEIAFCLPKRLRMVLGETPHQLTLIESNSRLVPGTTDRTATVVQQQLESRGVKVLLNRRVTRVEQRLVKLDDGQALPADLVLWATSAMSPPLLSKLGLPLDDRGFLLTRPTLQTTADLPIFAVGDSGTIAGEPLPKAGVYAVREGPILWENIERQLAGQPLALYRPQRGFLKLINTGDDRAIGEYRGFTFSGRWAWKLKDRIDRRFMAMYQDYTPTNMSEQDESDPHEQLRCAGCGGKVGGSVLAKALARLEVPPHANVVLGLAQPDDAAVVQPTPGKQIAVTTDFFAPPFEDAYLVGRMAALHSASDVLAKGATPIAGLAIATIPPGTDEQQEQFLSELLTGGLEELTAMGATLVGGHTIEGPQTMIGYTILAEQPAAIRTKGGLRPGDALVLTKPLGTGVSLAAHMQARLKARWWHPLVQTMLRSNAPAAALCDEFQVQAATDVTGFGLAGHLLEMLRASGVAAQIELDQVPLLDGTINLFAERLESTLAPANRWCEPEMEASDLKDSPAYPILFDPQTCGGLLIGIEANRAAEFCRRLQEAGDIAAAVIGRITSHTDNRQRLTIRCG